jgi:hypothetical protein
MKTQMKEGRTIDEEGRTMDEEGLSTFLKMIHATLISIGIMQSLIVTNLATVMCKFQMASQCDALDPICKHTVKVSRFGDFLEWMGMSIIQSSSFASDMHHILLLV